MLVNHLLHNIHTGWIIDNKNIAISTLSVYKEQRKLYNIPINKGTNQFDWNFVIRYHWNLTIFIMVY